MAKAGKVISSRNLPQQLDPRESGELLGRRGKRGATANVIGTVSHCLLGLGHTMRGDPD